MHVACVSKILLFVCANVVYWSKPSTCLGESRIWFHYLLSVIWVNLWTMKWVNLNHTQSRPRKDKEVGVYCMVWSREFCRFERQLQRSPKDQSQRVCDQKTFFSLTNSKYKDFGGFQCCANAIYPEDWMRVDFCKRNYALPYLFCFSMLKKILWATCVIHKYSKCFCL